MVDYAKWDHIVASDDSDDGRADMESADDGIDSMARGATNRTLSPRDAETFHAAPEHEEETSQYLRYCSGCRAPRRERKPQRCAACMAVVYCDRGCQRSHWNAHRSRCVAIVSAKEYLMVRDDGPVYDLKQRPLVASGSWRVKEEPTFTDRDALARAKSKLTHGCWLSKNEVRAVYSNSEGLSQYNAATGWTVAHHVCAIDREDVSGAAMALRILKSLKVDLNQVTTPGMAGNSACTPAHIAVQYDNAELLLVLHELGADLLAKTATGSTALGIAARRGKMRSFVALASLPKNRVFPTVGPLAIRSDDRPMNACDCVYEALTEALTKPSGSSKFRDHRVDLDPALWRAAWQAALRLGGPPSIAKRDSRRGFEQRVADLLHPDMTGYDLVHPGVVDSDGNVDWDAPDGPAPMPSAAAAAAMFEKARRGGAPDCPVS